MEWQQRLKSGPKQQSLLDLTAPPKYPILVQRLTLREQLQQAAFWKVVVEASEQMPKPLPPDVMKLRQWSEQHLNNLNSQGWTMVHRPAFKTIGRVHLIISAKV